MITHVASDYLRDADVGLADCVRTLLTQLFIPEFSILPLMNQEARKMTIMPLSSSLPFYRT